MNSPTALLRSLAILPIMFASAGRARQPEVTVAAETVATTEDGTKIEQYTMTNSRGIEVSVITHGATITGVRVPDDQGDQENITLHFDTPQRYLKGHPLFGSIVGRYANRIANARFSIDGTEYRLTANAGKHHIHGGREGFQKLVWAASPIRQHDRAGVEFTHTSPDGHEGYPGTLEVKLHYLLTADNELVLEYWATTDKPTHVNLTNHAYWNLGGVRAGNVLDHVMMINADQYLDADSRRFPTGEILSVEGTPLDFRTPHSIGSRIDQLESKNYDDCYVLKETAGAALRLAAHVHCEESGRAMEVYTTAPGMQFYTAKALNGRLGAKGVSYGPYHGFCLETQHFPDSPNQPHFPSTLIRPGERYHQLTIYRFQTKG
ncbi:MAG: aldose epimerase family protein [Planctomycetota bacterium]